MNRVDEGVSARERGGRARSDELQRPERPHAVLGRRGRSVEESRGFFGPVPGDDGPLLALVKRLDHAGNDPVFDGEKQVLKQFFGGFRIGVDHAESRRDLLQRGRPGLGARVRLADPAEGRAAHVHELLEAHRARRDHVDQIADRVGLGQLALDARGDQIRHRIAARAAGQSVDRLTLIRLERAAPLLFGLLHGRLGGVILRIPQKSLPGRLVLMRFGRGPSADAEIVSARPRELGLKRLEIGLRLAEFRNFGVDLLQLLARDDVGLAFLFELLQALVVFGFERLETGREALHGLGDLSEGGRAFFDLARARMAGHVREKMGVMMRCGFPQLTDAGHVAS